MSSINSEISISESQSPPLLNQPANNPQLHRTTIARRAKGKIQPRQQYRKQCGLLTQIQEQQLLQFINNLTQRGLPPNHFNVRVFAQNICGKWPGKNWASSFVKRHQDLLASEYLVGFDISRKRADNWWLINNYFNLVQEKWKEHDYLPKNIYNMDEKGFLIGVLKKTRRIFTRSWKKQGKLQGAAQDGNRSWITLIACICADGTSLPPALIYQASSGDIQDSWLEDYQPDDEAYFASSPTGWSNNELAMDWLIRVFDRTTKKKAGNGREPRLLFLDGHGSHINMPFLEWCYAHNIHVCAYPPHTTHRLQPLDKSLFSPLATYYSQELDSWIQRTQGLCKMNKRQFYKLFKPAFENAFSEHNIRSGWTKTGTYPLNPAQVLDQLSTKPAPSTSRPTTASSGSQSAISLSDWRKINQVVKEAVGDVLGYEGRQVLKVCHQLQAENALLKAQIEGLKEAVYTEKKQRKPKKALFAELRTDQGNGAVFFSPAKISAARELQIKKAKEVEAAQAQKCKEQLQRQLRKEEQAEIKRQAAAARQERQEKAAAKKAEKQACKEEALQQRLASLQLSNEQRAAGKPKQKKAQKAQDQILCGGATTKLSESRVVLQQEMRTSRSGRQLRKPQYLDNYEL
jgi:hypothetical protein